MPISISGSGTITGTSNITIGSGSGTAITVDTNNRVFTPARPAFLAQAVHADANYASGTVLPWPNIIYNNGNCYSTSTNRFTAPTSGVYFFSYNVWHSGTTTNRCYIRINGNEVYGGTATRGIHARLGAVGSDSATLSCILSLNINDYVDVYHNGDSGNVTLFYANYFTGFQVS